jgi:hypothetical protein
MPLFQDVPIRILDRALSDNIFVDSLMDQFYDWLFDVLSWHI